MKIRASILPAPRGTLMVFALLIMLVATLFIAGTASLMTNRATQSSYMDLFMKRRIALENSKSFNQELILEKTFLTSSTVAGSLIGLFPDNWGGIHTSDGWTNMRIFTPNLIPSEQTTAYPYNYGGLRPSGSFIATERTVRPPALDGASDPYGGIDAFSAYSFLKSFPPTLGGDGLVVYRKPTAAAGQIEIGDTPTGPLRIRVVGRTVVRDPDSFFAPSTPSPLELRVHTDSLYIQKHTDRRIYARNIVDGEKVPPSNLPAVRSTVGPNVETITTSDLFAGSLDVINNPTHPDNSLWHFMDREQAAGRTSFTDINSSDPVGTSTDPFYVIHYNPSDTGNLPPYMPPTYDTSPLAFPNPYRILYINLNHANLTHLRLTATFDQVVLVGQVGAAAYNAAGLMTPIIIAGLSDASSGTNRYMYCANENNRRIVFAVGDTNGSDLDMYWVGSSASFLLVKWRMVLINQYRTITMYLPGILKSVRLTGGVMTNWTVKRSGIGAASRLTFEPESNPEPVGATGPKFSTLIPRDAWMENYFFPTPP